MKNIDAYEKLKQISSYDPKTELYEVNGKSITVTDIIKIIDKKIKIYKFKGIKPKDSVSIHSKNVIDKFTSFCALDHIGAKMKIPAQNRKIKKI